ncbi:MAG: C1 family peptidase [Chloroflexi bacterium]|nr:C1 family peptidase [Chloroflexota bacterium]
MVKEIGTPLSQTDLSPDQIRALEALSITRVEELLGLPPYYLNKLAPYIPDFAKVKKWVSAQTPPQMEVAAETGTEAAEVDLAAEEYAMGALPPRRQLAHMEAQFFIPEQPNAALAEAQGERAVNLVAHFPPVRDQGRRGTCVAYAVVAMREYAYKLKNGEEVALSEQFLYWLCKENDNRPRSHGTFAMIAVPIAVRFGICLATTWPYNPEPMEDNEGQGPPPEGAMEEASRYKVRQGLVLDPRSVEDIQERLENGYPVAVSIPAYRSWLLNPVVRRTGNIQMPVPGTRASGGHAVLIVGFGADPEFAGGGYFIVRNSWGTRWGVESPFGVGYGTLPYNYIRYYGWEAFSCND